MHKNSSKTCKMLVAFADINGFVKFCSRKNPSEIFKFLSEFYLHSGNVISKYQSGKIVKFMGDSMLIVFDENFVKEGVDSLKELQSQIDKFLLNFGKDLTLSIKANFGEVACGEIGTETDKRFDVFGNTVNKAALLTDGDFVLSEDLKNFIKKGFV